MNRILRALVLVVCCIEVLLWWMIFLYSIVGGFFWQDVVVGPLLKPLLVYNYGWTFVITLIVWSPFMIYGMWIIAKLSFFYKEEEQEAGDQTKLDLFLK